MKVIYVIFIIFKYILFIKYYVLISIEKIFTIYSEIRTRKIRIRRQANSPKFIGSINTFHPKSPPFWVKKIYNYNKKYIYNEIYM